MLANVLRPDQARSRVQLRVRFCDTDLMGIVHHANYLAYFEAGRVEWLRRRGVTYTAWAERGLHLAVVEVGLRYHGPARFDDVLTVHVELTQVRAASARFEYRIDREEMALASGFTLLACINDKQKLQRIAPDMVAVLTSGEGGETDAVRP